MTATTPSTAAAGEKVIFDPESHRYTMGGRVLPSVTQIINSLMPGWQADEWYMQRGTAMHYGCQLLDAGQLDWSSVAPEIEGRVRAWERFRKDYPGVVVAAEQPLCHGVYGFAGTLDRVFVNSGSALVLCDIKSSISPQAKVQLGAYKKLWDECGDDDRQITDGVVVELSDDATYRTLWVGRKEMEYAGRTFLACLTVHGFKQREGLK